MASITIVGLGPGAADDLTRAAWQVLCSAEEVWLRTLRHPVVAELPGGLSVHSFDDVYERAGSFADVYAEISAQVLTLGQREQGVVYAVPGHPMVGEATVLQIVEQARVQSVPVRIVAGLSFIEPALTLLERDALDGLQVVDALDVLALHHPPLNPDAPALIAQVYSRAIASDLKLVLMNQYGDEHPTALIDAAGTASERIMHIPLYEIDRHEATPLTSLYVAPLPAVTSFEGFQETVARLRSPEGCPWDREQTHQSLRTNLLEEAYEVLEAIDADDPDGLREELGDLLLQVVLHAQIAVEDEDFRMTEVIAQIDSKLKRRHPHVWGEVAVAGVGDVVTNWEAIKRRERAAKGAADRSLLDGIPTTLPALAQAAAYVSRAGRIGFSGVETRGVWVDLPDDVARLLDRLIAALGDAVARTDAPAPSGMHDPSGPREPVGSHGLLMETREAVARLGDLLLVLADWARQNEIDPESALREANQRFVRRFRVIERAMADGSLSLDTLTVDGIRHLWAEHEVP